MIKNMSSDNSYGARLIHLMLTKEQVFIPFQSCYYLLYQCLVPNTREALSLLIQHYSVPEQFKSSILSGENPRVCNQGILNYLLIKLRADKDFVKFWSSLAMMIKQPELRTAIERIRKQKALSKDAEKLLSTYCGSVTKVDDLESLFPTEEGALSMANDDDFCVDYTVTIVDIRSCTRPPRSPGHYHTDITKMEMSSLTLAQKILVTNSQFVELQSHYSVLVRSMPDDYMNTVNQLERHLTGDHIGSILECSDVFTANQRILDCLVVQLDDKEDIFDLCDQLSLITNTPLLTSAIEDLKIDVITGIRKGDSAGSTGDVDVEASLNSLRLNDLSSSAVSVPLLSTIKPERNIFDRIDPGRFGLKALGILKKHYHYLWRCFPEDYMSSLAIVCEECSVGDEIIELITSYPTPELCNQEMLNYIIFITRGDDQMMAFCRLMDKLITNPRLSKIVGALRKDCTDIMLEGWLQSFLLRRTGTAASDDDDDDATKAEPTVTTFREDTTLPTASSGPSQQDGGDIGALVIERLPAGVSAQCRTMLRSHYDTLWKSFPHDHLITLSRLCNLLPVDEGLVETIALYPTSDHDVANRRILNAALSNVKHDSVLLGFCVLIEKLIENLEEAKMIEKLRSDCLKVMQKKPNIPIKPSLTSATDATQSDDVPTPLTTESEESSRADTSTSGTAAAGLAAAKPVRLLDSDPLILHYIPSTVSDDAIALLRKYYNILLNCFSDDHITTIALLSGTVSLREGFFEEIIAYTDPREANERVLHAIIGKMEHDQQLVNVCEIVKAVIGSKQDSDEFLEFEIECNKFKGRPRSSTKTVAREGRNVVPGVICRLSGKVNLACCLVLKKYYNFLWQSFPQDHLTTLSRFSKIVRLSDHLVDAVVSSSTSDDGNQKILNICVLSIDKDRVLIEFSDLVNKIIDNPKLSTMMKVFKKECEAAVKKSLTSTSANNLTVVNDLNKSLSSIKQPLSDMASKGDVSEDGSGTNAQATVTAEVTQEDCIPAVFSELPSDHLSTNAIAVLKKHYYPVLRSFPSDHMISLGRLCQVATISDTTVDKIISCSSPTESNRAVIDNLICITDDDSRLVKFCDAIEVIVGSATDDVVESLRHDCLKILNPQEEEQSTSSSSATTDDTPAQATSQQSSADTTSDVTHTATAVSSNECSQLNLVFNTSPSVINLLSSPSITSGLQEPMSATSLTVVPPTDLQQKADDTKAALRAFDEHLHLMTLIEPSCIRESLQTSGLLASNDSFTSTPSLPSSTVMENVLKEVRHCIELNGATKFIVFVNVLQTEGRYVVFGSHLLYTYRHHGGHECNAKPTLTGLPTLLPTDLMEQLKWHQHQLRTGLQYQCPLPLPDYYIQRDQLLEVIINKFTENDSMPTVGTTVTISGVGGIGKSTLAKALCHDLRIRNCFLDGFLWIRLGPLPVSPAIKLGQLYHLLSNGTEVGNQSFFTDKLQSLISNHLHKLLVIIDDVWEVSDALVYTQVFTGCNIVMTTRRENVNKLIPSKMCITVERMNEEEATKLLTQYLPKEIPIKDANYLVQDMNHLPLLLDLVGSQLATYCAKQHKPLEQVVDCVHDILNKTEPSSGNVGKSVMAVVKSSIDLLDVDELHVLEKLVLSMGCYMPIPVTFIPTVLKVSEEEADRLCKRLLELRLLLPHHLIIAPNNKCILCYEIHPVVTQHIFDHVKFKSPAELASALDPGDFTAISKVLAGEINSNITHYCLATITVIDLIILPNHISSLFATAKCLQHEINEYATKLSSWCVSSGKPDLVVSVKDNDTFTKSLHETIRDDCKSLHHFLVNNKHDEAIEWLTGYIKNHPLRTVVRAFTTFVKDLLSQCQDDQSLVARISSYSDRMIQFYKTVLLKRTKHAWITLRRGLTAMVNSGDVTLEQYQNLIDSHRKDLEAITVTN